MKKKIFFSDLATAQSIKLLQIILDVIIYKTNNSINLTSTKKRRKLAIRLRIKKNCRINEIF